MFYCFKAFLYHSPFSKRNETLPVYWTTENSSRTQCTSAQIFIRPFVLVENGNLYTEQKQMTQNQQIKQNNRGPDKSSSGSHKMDRKCATQVTKVNCVGLFISSTYI